MGHNDPASPSGAERTWLTGLTTAILMVCAASNSAFLLWPVVGVRLDLYSSFVSEFSAQNEPGAMFYRFSDFLTGASLLAGSYLMWNVFPKRFWVRLSQIALILFSLMSMADSFLPLDCAPTQDAACRERESLGLISFAHQMHNLTGILGSTCLSVAMVVLGVALWRTPGWKRLSRWSLPLGVFYVTASLVIVGQYMREVPGLGITQRAQILAFSAFLVVLALTQRKLPRDSAAVQEPRLARINDVGDQG